MLYNIYFAMPFITGDSSDWLIEVIIYIFIGMPFIAGDFSDWFWGTCHFTSDSGGRHLYWYFRLAPYTTSDSGGWAAYEVLVSLVWWYLPRYHSFSGCLYDLCVWVICIFMCIINFELASIVGHPSTCDGTPGNSVTYDGWGRAWASQYSNIKTQKIIT